MIRVGDKVITLQTTFVCADNEVVSFSANLNGPTVTFNVRFIPGQPGAQPSTNWRVEANTIHLDFVAWSNSLGTSFTTPARIATIGQTAVGIQVAHFKVGLQNLVHLQVLLGGAYAGQ